MNLVINTEEIKNRITFNKKSRRFEFRVLSKGKTRLDIDYYPLIQPRGLQDLTEEIQNAIVKLIVSSLNKINTDSSVHTPLNVILLDIFTDIPTKSYNIWSKSGKFLGTISTSASPEVLEDVILKLEPKAHQYQEVIKNNTNKI